MPLTPTEVRQTKFGTTRMRAGYDMDEVDAFLDIIEADVAQYSDELQRCRDGEAVLRTQGEQLQARLTMAEERLVQAQESLAERQAAERAQAAAPPVIAADVAELIAGDPDAAAVLAIAQRTADEIVRYAEHRAEAIRSALRATLREQLAAVDGEPVP